MWVLQVSHLLQLWLPPSGLLGLQWESPQLPVLPVADLCPRQAGFPIVSCLGR